MCSQRRPLGTPNAPVRSIVQIAVLSALAASAAQPAASQSAGDGADIQPTDTVVVFGKKFVTDTSIGRNSLTVDEFARSIQIIEAPLIAELKPFALEDVLALSSNVSFLGDNDGRENTFTLRGFQNPPVLRDGFRVETFGGVADPELFILDRIEILKGPDSILYGESNPGGIINLHSKRPLDEDHGFVELETSSFPSVSPRLDFGGGSERIRYRVVALYRYDEGWRDFENANKRFTIAPTLTWAPSDETVLTLIGEVTEDDFQADFGTAINAAGELTAPPEQVNNHPLDTIDRFSYTAGFDIIHKFSDALQVEGRFRWINGGYEYSPLFLPFDYDPDANIYTRVPAQQEQDNEELAGQFNLNAEFPIAGMRNRLTAGVDVRASETTGNTRFDPETAVFLDWGDPDYSVLPPAAEDIPPAFFNGEDITRVGVFLQNHLNVVDALMLSFGVRFDDVERDPAPGSTSSAQSYDNTAFQGGVRYDVTDSLSVFGNYSQSFSPNFDLDKNFNVLEPETGDGFEVGVKGRLFGGGVFFTAAYFDITKENVAITDFSALPTDPNPFGSIAQGEQTARGGELDFSGQITDRWQVTASVGFVDTEDETGAEIVGAADVSSALWTTYQITEKFSISGGYEFVGERLVTGDLNFDGDMSDAVFLDSHFLLNAAARYESGPWRVQLNLSNLTDKEYVDAAFGGLARSVHAGAPFQALLSLGYTFK